MAELFGDASAAGWAGIAIAEPHVIESEGLVPKRHPCCGSTHYTVDAILGLKAEHGFTSGDVLAETLVGIANARNLAYPDPEDEMQARFSMHYCVALALLQDRLSLADFTPEAVQRQAVRELLPRTVMRAYDKSEEAAAGRLPHRVTVRVPGGIGRTLTVERSEAKGSIADPFDDMDRELKFSSLCGHDERGRDRDARRSARRHRRSSQSQLPVPRIGRDGPRIGEPARHRAHRCVRRTQGHVLIDGGPANLHRAGRRCGTVEADFGGQLPGGIGRRHEHAAAQLLGNQAFRIQAMPRPARTIALRPTDIGFS